MMRPWMLVVLLAGVALAQAAGAESPDPAKAPVAAWGRLTGEYTALYQQGKLADAEAAAGQALAVAEQAFGAGDPRVAQVLNDLGRLQAGQQRHEEALAADQRALQIRRQQPSPDPAAVAQSLRNLALDYHALQRLEEAEQALAEALKVVTGALAADHPYRLDTLADVALARMERGQAAAAEPLFAELETHGAALNGLGQHKLALVWQQHAACLMQLDRRAEAEAMQKRAATMRALIGSTQGAP